MKMKFRAGAGGKRIGVLAAASIFTACALWLSAAPEPATVPPPPPTQVALQQGLSLTIEPLPPGVAPSAADVQSVRLVGLYVPQGKAPSSMTPAGRFRATWDGNINVKLREKFSFLAAGRGALKMSIDDKPVLDVSGEDFSQKPSEEIRLKKGANHVVIVYESPEAGDAIVRLLWTQKGVPPEPVPPTAFSHDPQAPGTKAGNQVRAGRMLLAELRCTKCHAASDIVPPTQKDAMPELSADAPSLKDVGARLNRNWMAAWIDDPKALRHDAHMPRLFQNGTAGNPDARALDAAAYLASLGASAKEATAPPDDAGVKVGGELFTSLFCAACHVPPSEAADAATKGPVDRISLAHVAAKFTAAGLEEYLANPQAHFAWNPMPNFKLAAPEAAALSAYLMKQTRAAEPLPAGDPAKGKAVVLSAGCLNCHELDGANTFKAPDLSKLTTESWSRGCMAIDPGARKTAPDYAMNETDRAELTAFAITDHTSLSRDCPSEFSARQFTAMRCAACHPRDGQQPAIITTASADISKLYDAFFPSDAAAKPTSPSNPAPAAAAVGGEQHPLAPDQRSLPLLTWVGEKLRPEWAAACIKGDVGYKPRYYLRSRMPAFAARAEGLAHGFSAEHGFAPNSPAPGASDPQMTLSGQKLIGANGGFSCVQCHAVGPQGALAPFEAPAINFEHVSERLRKEYYDRWMRNPIRVDPATKMPQFGDSDMQSAIKAFYEGDAKKQFDAIWQFLLQGKDVKPPQ